MPNRIIKESIKKSPTIDQLSWFEEIVFYRIIVTADDYGRLDGRITILKNELFPTKESITKKNIEDALGKLVSVGLVCRYIANDIPYLFLPTWESHQQIRAKRSRFPEPDIICNQMISDDIKCTRNPIQSESETESKSKTAAGDIFESRSFSDAMKSRIEEWIAYKKERKEIYQPIGLKSLLTQIENKIKEYSESQVYALIGDCMACNYSGIIWEKIAKRGDSNEHSGGFVGKLSGRENRKDNGTVQKPKYSTDVG